ncbi:hypothetical protein CALCODRAFT_357697 [Calocera cornea HHB12733]|uniref:Uncharacterized protein n=1 Tax=Calocera cornea HHB12733 TaxID=1353952 RepID=A0A165EPD7_9BASI|nr:hypothetical protein CALCODRAFT_357697 [Calocera cornea HHB12733]
MRTALSSDVGTLLAASKRATSTAFGRYLLSTSDPPGQSCLSCTSARSPLKKLMRGWKRIETYATSIQELDMGGEEEEQHTPGWDETIDELYEKLEGCTLEPLLPPLRSIKGVCNSPTGSQYKLAQKLIYPALSSVDLCRDNCGRDRDPYPSHIH